MKFINVNPKNVLEKGIKAVGETPANTTRATLGIHIISPKRVALYCMYWFNTYENNQRGNWY